MSRMDSTLFLSYAMSPQLYGVPADMYNQVYSANPSITQPSSFMRSSAQQPSSPRQYYQHNYSHSPAEAYQDEGLSSSTSSSSSNGLPAAMAVGNVQDHPQDFSEPSYTFTATTAAMPYSLESSIPRGVTYANEGQTGYPQLSPTKFEPQLDGRYPDAPVYAQGYFDHSSESQYPPPEMSQFYDSHTPSFSQEPALSAYTLDDGQLPSVVHSFSHSPRMEHRGSPESIYTGGSPLLQYPTTPDEAPQYVSLQDVSPSPAVSPDQVYSSLPSHSPTLNTSVLTGSYVAGPPASPSSAEYEDPMSDVTSSVDMTRQLGNAPDGAARKRYRLSSDDEDSRAGSVESGESEREEYADDADDDEYRPDAREGARSSGRRRPSAKNQNARSVSPLDPQRPRLAPPVPVPNLTKKSRGRRVPTSSVLVSQNGVEKNVRGYKCKVPGCNKCFQRGEHLKRHVRSIHTNEKPHKCPYQKCGKDFSRHDNLRQHMRVHRNEPLDSEDTASA